MVANAAPRQVYKREDVLRLLKIHARRFQSWEKLGLVRPGQLFSFRDLIELRTLQKLAENKIAPRQISDAIASLKQKLREIDRPLNDLKIASDGKTITVHWAGQKMEAISGQLLFNFDAAELETLQMPEPKKPLGPTPAEAEAERWFQQGLSLEEAGAPIEQAQEAYEKAVELNPNASGALVNLGTIAFRAKKLRKAGVYYERAIAADPTYALAHFNMGNLFDEMGDWKRARTHYETALSINPAQADAHFNLALIAEREDDRPRAVRHWRAYLQLDTNGMWADLARKQLDRLTQLKVVE